MTGGLVAAWSDDWRGTNHKIVRPFDLAQHGDRAGVDACLQGPGERYLHGTRVSPSRFTSNNTPLKLAALSEGQNDAAAVGTYSGLKIAL